MNKLMNVYASDWKFESIIEFDKQIDPQLHAQGIRLFVFQSNINSLGAWVTFVGHGVGSGLKFTFTNEVVKVGLANLERLAKPSIGSEVKLSLPRKKVPELSLKDLSENHSFSLSQLNGSIGNVSSVGVGMGIGVGGSFVTAGDLFTCTNLGFDFGRIGLSVNNLQGWWHVHHVWETV
jgi:hypothetical protein